MAHDACPDENYQVACLDEYYQEQLPIIEQRICSSAGNEIRRYVMTNPDHRAVFSSFIHDDAAWASVSENLRNLLRYEITMSFFTEKALNQTYMFPDAVTYIEERSAQLASATTELPGTGDLEFEQATDGSRVEGGELACLAFLNDPEKFKACQKTKFRHNSRLREHMGVHVRSFQCPACLETFPRKNNLSAHHGERKCNKKNKGGRQRISDDQRNFDGLLKKKNGDRLTVEGIKEFLKKDNIVVVPLHEKRKNRKKANPSPKASAKKRKPNDGTTDTTTTYVNSENASCIDTGNAISEGYDHVMSDCVCDLFPEQFICSGPHA